MDLADREARLRDLVEVELIRLLPDPSARRALGSWLAEAIRGQVNVHKPGEGRSPSAYRFILPGRYSGVVSEPQLVNLVRRVILADADGAPPASGESPAITVEFDATLAPDDVRVLSADEADALDETRATEVHGDRGATPPGLTSAYLILDGIKVYPIMQAVTNIGRRLENELVIDDPRVSRLHAQVRQTNGRFVIFDLGSTGGTFVNGERITEGALRPGDVISLAGVSLVFGTEGATEPQSTSETAPAPSHKVEDATLIAGGRADTGKAEKP